MRVLRRGTACAVQVPTRSMTAATAHNQRRESGSRTAPATQNGAESAIQANTRTKCERKSAAGAVAAANARGR